MLDKMLGMFDDSDPGKIRDIVARESDPDELATSAEPAPDHKLESMAGKLDEITTQVRRLKARWTEADRDLGDEGVQFRGSGELPTGVAAIGP